MKYLILMLAALTLISCGRSQSQDQPVFSGKDIGVSLASEVAVRIDPTINSARIVTLSVGDHIEIIDRSRTKATIAGKQDYWYKIKLRSGISGWVYGQNLKIFKEGSDSSIERFATELRSEETAKVIKELTGKWWSVALDDTYTNNILSIRSNGTYASLEKNSQTPIQGEYTVDSLRQTISFSKGTTFGDTANYIIRGDFIVIEAEKNSRRTKLKKRSSDPEFKHELEAREEADEKPQEVTKPATQ